MGNAPVRFKRPTRGIADNCAILKRPLARSNGSPRFSTVIHRQRTRQGLDGPSGHRDKARTRPKPLPGVSPCPTTA